MSIKSTQCVLILAALWLGGAALACGDDDMERLFTLKVLPLLKDKCQGCHGADPQDLKGDFSVVDRASLLRGGESEVPAIVPGDVEAGTLVPAIAWEDYEMPPKENDRLTNQQIDVFRLWIARGAPWPSESRQQEIREEAARQRVNDEGVLFSTSGGTSAEWTNRRYQPEDLWAFQPVVVSGETLPQGLPVHEAIDSCIDRRLQSEGLPKAPRAEPAVLIRRASLDLTGLPPTPEAVTEFLEASAKDPEGAWSDLIDRLLASPQYGERWARHWLDVTRYADTGGMSNDYERSNMWRYRDYVIRAFNEDKPYNQFIVEQLAGDELADASVRERAQGNANAVQEAQMKGDYTEEESEWLVATGFLRLGPWDNAMVEREEARQMYLDDLVNITGQTFLSQTLRCCKCHDHKFDPIPTRDYYSMYAAFATTHMAERAVPFLPTENLTGFDEGKAHVQHMLDYAVSEKNRLIAKREAAARAWYAERGLPYQDEKERQDLPDEQKPPRHVGLDHTEQGQLKVREQDEWIWQRRLERYQPMAQSVYNAGDASLAWNGARKLRIKRSKKQDTPGKNFILVGGALTALGDQVGPGVLSAVTLGAPEVTRSLQRLPGGVDGRRLALARWIAHPQNALTTRSIVNRLWQSHFGVGLAANANNFGAKGARPSHPELLDYLAADLVAGGWKLKRLHRQMMLSHAYQRSSTPPASERLAEVDPNNALLAFFPRRRLMAEELRDSLLSATGELNLTSGGLPVMPEINMEVALQPRMIQFSLAPAYQPSPTPEQRNRRSIYAYQVRGQADPFSELFNQPNPNESCELRESAAVTPQVFTLLNSEMMTNRSIALALRVQSEESDLSDQLNAAFNYVLLRDAAEPELDRLSAYVTDMREYHATHSPEPRVYPTEITRSLVEEFTGQPFEYTEILPVFQDYQRDTQPVDTTPETRALADVCLLLYNTNEFMYVD